MSLHPRRPFIMCRHRRQFITVPWSMALHILTAITGIVTADPLVVVAPSMRDPLALESSYLSPTTVSYMRLAHTQTSKIERRQDMTRMLILATFSLAATTLPLLAQTPNGPVQGTVKGTAMVGQGVVQGTGQAGQGIAQGSASVARGAGQATVGVARGAGTVAAKTGRGAWCIVTLGYGC
jgi:hypothetical protein